MVDPTMVALVGDELRRIAERGELASRAQLQEAVGIGAGDLELALDTLRERGEASEFEPDRFGVPVSEEDGEREDDAAPQREMAGRASDAEATERGPTNWRIASQGAQVTMPRAVAAVLDEAALGKLLKAGIEAAGEGETFVFEVSP